MTEENPAYITILATRNPHMFLVVVMKYSEQQDGYVQTRVSTLLNRIASAALATNWSAATGYEVKL